MAHWAYVTATAVFAAYILARQHLTFSTWILIFVPTAWAFYAAYLVLIYPFFFSPFRDLPEPEGAKLPWSHAGFMKSMHHGAAFRHWIGSVPNEGMMRIRVLLNQERLFLTSSEAIRELQVTRAYDFVKPPAVGELFKQLVGNGLLVSEGAEHQRQRKALMPAFSYRHIRDLFPLFWDKSRQSVEAIAQVSKGSPEKPQEAYIWASRVTLDIIGVAGMGYDFNAVGDPDGHIVANYRALFGKEPPPVRWITLGIRLPLALIFKLPIPSFTRVRNAAATIKDFAYKMVQERRLALEKADNGMVDIMSVAMRSGQFTSDEEVVNQMMTFLAAGHETTASALTWATYLMCKHPDIQERLRQEIRSSLPPVSDPASTITAEDFDKVPYLNAVCNEVLRFIPSVPMSPRVAQVDTTIMGRHIPKGTYILASQWATNTDSKVWGATAMEFDPERWMGAGMANSGGAKNNFANLTFLHGPRSCIGQGFSKAEFAVLVAAWVGKFMIRWENEKKPLQMDITGSVTLHPGHNLPVVFEEIPGW